MSLREIGFCVARRFIESEVRKSVERIWKLEESQTKILNFSYVGSSFLGVITYQLMLQ
jgi:hypothetical protein